MSLEEYLGNLPTKKRLSEVKQKIIKRLWGDENISFPKPWVSSKELLELTGQKYFDRRTRELRDELGCDIESQYSKEHAGHSWRLKSSNLTLPKNREYLSQKDKNKLFESYNNKCAICGTLVPPGIRGLQADHKKPLSRGGGNELENWQPLCHNCNVGKKSACKGCELECSTCSWAYPDKVGIKTIVSINQEVLDQVKIYASKKESTIDKVMEEAIKYFITKKDQ